MPIPSCYLQLINHPETSVNKYTSSNPKSAHVRPFTYYYPDMLQTESDIDLRDFHLIKKRKSIYKFNT